MEVIEKLSIRLKNGETIKVKKIHSWGFVDFEADTKIGDRFGLHKDEFFEIIFDSCSYRETVEDFNYFLELIEPEILEVNFPSEITNHRCENCKFKWYDRQQQRWQCRYLKREIRNPTTEACTKWRDPEKNFYGREVKKCLPLRVFLPTH